MNTWQQLALFAGQTTLVVFGAVLILFVLASLASRSRSAEVFKVDNLNRKFRQMARMLREQTFPKKELKLWIKEQKQLLKKAGVRPRVYVIDFEGDLRASHVENLRKEVSMILTAAKPGEEVVAVIESSGGLVHSYGLAASQLIRLKDHGLKLTVCVDKVAASGGYLMAVVADQILAAPFALIGSIGVVAQIPNFHRLLQKNNVDYEEFTAGDFKRTVSLFGAITEKGRMKFLEQLEDTHNLFKDFVSSFRPQLDLAKVATGEYWYGKRAIDLKLIDQVRTSDDYLQQLAGQAEVFRVHFGGKKKISERLAESVRILLREVFSAHLA